jgi:hypothetical protein
MREVTRWLAAHRRRLSPPEPQELRALQRLAGSLAQGEPDPGRLAAVEQVHRSRVVDSGLLELMDRVEQGPPPLLVWDLLRSAGYPDPSLAWDQLDELRGARRRAAGLLVSCAGALVAAGILAGRVPASPGALAGVGGALRKGQGLLEAP